MVLCLAAAPTKAAPPASAAQETARAYPRLVLAGGPTLGPHRFGIETCLDDGRCDRTGNHLGMGGTIELRARAWRPLYAHVRGLFTGNVARDNPLYGGVMGPGIGFGAYSKWAMVRAEYLLVFPLGDNRYERPFGEGDVITEEWSPHAGLFSAGVRYKPIPRLALELWGGFMLGPRAERQGQYIDDIVEDKTGLLKTFIVGLGVAYDVVQ